MIPNILLKILKSRKKSLSEQLKLFQFLEIVDLKHGRSKLSEVIKINHDIPIISEIKSASPSQGDIRKDMDIPQIAHIMEDSGVIGLSVLTEPIYFNGSFLNLYLALKGTSIPCLMKDFVFSENQFKIAKDVGATNILLINLLGNTEEMYELSMEFDLEPLIEIHDIAEITDLKNLKEIGIIPPLVGINNRSLKTLEVDLNTSKQLIPEVKKLYDNKVSVISESGINSFEDIKFLQSCGADGFLIGSSIMQSKDIKKQILHLRGIN
ncbi:MAG: indole-3-glycerol-phosphate synthase [Promethearchaeota archaeon]|nr:MAG: indole-3-glycerol-phosphate synthase [Candidatus Lokiarchaeota archaeon]